MRRQKFNTLKTNILEDVETPVEIEEDRFWKYYLTFIRLRGLDITDTDIDFLIMFLNDDFEEIVKVKKYTPQYVWEMKRRLTNAGLLIKEGRNKYRLHSSLSTMKKLISSNQIESIDFIFPFKVV